MTDPSQADTPTPESNTDGTPSPNFVARSALRIMRRTERSLSPWIQRAWQAAQPSVGQRSFGSPQNSVTPESPKDNLGRTPFRATQVSTVGARMPLALSRRVQRLTDSAAVSLSQPTAKVGLSLDRLATTVVQRFPDTARKYESRSADETPAVQRSSLLYGAQSAGTSTPTEQFEPAAAVMPEYNQPEPDTSAGDQSLTAQLMARLQNHRSADNDSASADVQATSPRQISRKANEVAAARSGERLTVRRGKVEELGSKPEAIARPAETSNPIENKPQPKPQTVQRKEAGSPPAKGAQPSTPAHPATPRRSALEPAWASQPDPFEADWQPGLPSITQELTQRYMAQRSLAEATPKPPKSDDDNLPSWMRKDAQAKSSPTPKPVGDSAPNTAQRKPEIQRKPAPPARVEPTVSDKAKPTSSSQPAPQVRSETPAPDSIQREVEPRTDSKSEKDSSDPDLANLKSTKPVTTTLQRSVEAATPPVTNKTDLPLQRKAAAPKSIEPSKQPEAASEPSPEVKPAAQQIQRRAIESEPPLVESAPPKPTTVQRKPAPPSSEPPTVPTSTPVVQRTAAPPSPTLPAPSESSAKPESLQRAPEASRPVAETSDITIQRKSDLPLRTAPSKSAIAPDTKPSEPSRGPSLDESVLTRVQSSANLPLSTPVSIQRKAESLAPAAAPTQSPFESAPSVAPQTTKTVARSSLPLVSQPAPAQIQRVPQVQRLVSENTSDLAALFSKVAATTTLPQRVTVPTVQRKSTTPSAAPRTPLPLAKSVSRAETKVQRELAPTTTSTTAEPETNTETPAASGPDLLTLARQIYPLLKRMLAVERERR